MCKPDVWNVRSKPILELLERAINTSNRSADSFFQSQYAAQLR